MHTDFVCLCHGSFIRNNWVDGINLLRKGYQMLNNCVNIVIFVLLG